MWKYYTLDYGQDLYNAKREEVRVATNKAMEELARSYVYQPYVPAGYGWLHMHLELPKEKMEDKTNKKFWTIEVTLDSWRIETVNNGRKYDTEAAAIADAEKFAEINPGREYIVVQAVSRSFVAPAPKVTTRLG